MKMKCRIVDLAQIRTRNYLDWYILATEAWITALLFLFLNIVVSLAMENSEQP